MPGRLEFLGKHTDYAGGRSLVCALERGICMAARARDDARVLVQDVSDGEAAFVLEPSLAPAPGHWSNYPITVARRLARDFVGPLRGVDIAFASDLPPAAGLSSSSALIVACFVALADANALERHPVYARTIQSIDDLAGYLSAIESGAGFGSLTGDTGVGTHGGSEDHTAILAARPGTLRQYSFCPVRHERDIALPRDHVFVVAASGVTADKTGAARDRYNRTALATEVMLGLWCAATGRADPSLAAALASSDDAPERMRAVLQTARGAPLAPAALLERLEQFQAESAEIVPAAGDAVATGHLAALGRLVDRSQQLAERCLGNQVPETIARARHARALGAVAASAFGAGFGGSVWALVQTQAAPEFRERWTVAYRAEFPTSARRATFFVSRGGPGLQRL